MKLRRHWISLSLLFTTFAPGSAWSQNSGACLSIDEVADLAESALADAGATLHAEAKDDANEAAIVAPRSKPDSAKALMPSSLDGLTIADAAGFLDLLGLAYEGGLVESSDGRLTLTLSPFAVRTLADPKQLELQELYRSKVNGILRRINLSATAGGQGESFDQDGDGEEDEGKKAAELGDIVAAEIRVRLWGSRDRRDAANFGKIVAAVSDSERARALGYRSDFVSWIEASRVNRDAIDKGSDCSFDRSALAELDLGNYPEIREARDVVAAIRQRYEDAAAGIDGTPELSFFAAVVERKRAFGTDSVRAGFRFSSGSWNLNLDWTEVDLLDSENDAETYRGAFEYSTLWLKGRTPAGDGITASAQGSYEKVSNVPGAKFDTTAKVGLALEIPIADGLSLPVGVTWANHRSLLDEGDETLGHFGLKFDLESLWKASKQKQDD
jgi:hypothetical protein